MLERLGLSDKEIDDVLNKHIGSGDIPFSRVGIKQAITDAIIANNRKIEKQLEDIIGEYGGKD